MKEFAGGAPELNIAADDVRPREQSFAGSSLDFHLGKQETGALKKLASNQGVTLYMVILAVYYVLLSKLSGQEDIVVGTTVAGRDHPDLEQIIGLFINTLALRNYPAKEKTFTAFLGEVKQRTLAAFDNRSYQFDDLVENLLVYRDLSRNPLFDAMFSFDNISNSNDTGEQNQPGLKLKPYEYINKISTFDLTLVGVEARDKLLFSLEYSTDLFKKETIEKYIENFKEIAAAILKNNDIPLKEINISYGLSEVIPVAPKVDFGF